MLLTLLCTQPHAVGAEPSRGLDKGFMTQLRSAGILTAAESIGLDVYTYLLPLAGGADNPYRRYRWSAGSDGNGNMMINAVPPEEELGWTPSERWFVKDGKPCRESLVLYPVKEVNAHGMPAWSAIDEGPGLYPRFLVQPESLEDRLRRARVDVAAGLLGLDMQKEFIEPMSAKGGKIYSQFRWAVIPHRLAGNAPVITALPPMHRSGEWPWESWYTDGNTPVIHHVHFTAKTPRTTNTWRAAAGELQRPPEVFGVVWHWYDDLSMVPVLAGE
jgi:hypothetical protein